MADSENVSALVPHGGGKSKNLHIQWLRALAAFLVVLYHASIYQTAGIAHYEGVLTVFDGRLAYFPVALFFAISGYLMSVAVRVQTPFLFLSHRVVRIYPTFLGVCGAYYLAAWLLHMPVPVDWNALSLSPAGSPDYPLGIEWTLVFEVAFYVALFLVALLGAGKRIEWIAGAWFLYLAATSWSQTDSKFLLTTLLRTSEAAAMAGGLLVPVLLRTKLPPWVFLIVGLGIFLPVYGYLPVENDLLRWLSALSAILIVAGAVGQSQRTPEQGDNRIGRALARFGDYSFALYLVHVPIIHFVYVKIHGLAFEWLWLIVVPAALTVSLLVGRVDVWLYRHLKRLTNTARPGWRVAGVMVFLAMFLWVSLGELYARHLGIAAQAFATQMAPVIAISGPFATQEEIEAAAAKAGFARSTALIGTVDRIAWEKGNLSVEGWAVDAGKHGRPVSVAVFQDGVLLGVSAAGVSRDDISRHFHTHAMTGYRLGAVTPCDGGPVTVLGFTENKAFAILQNPQPPLTCAQP